MIPVSAQRRFCSDRSMVGESGPLSGESGAGETIAPAAAAERIEHDVAVDVPREVQRAARFGVSVVEPRKSSILGSRRAAARKGGGFATGFDVLAPEQAEKRAARAARFGPQLNSADASPDIEPTSLDGKNDLLETIRTPTLAEVNPLENRRDVALGEVARPCVVHVFGVDDMSTDDIKSHFQEYGFSWVEWINDSSLNVVFEDAHTASRILTFMVPSVPQDHLGDGSVSVGGVAGSENVLGDAPPDRMSDAENAGISAPVAAEGVTELPPEFVWRKLQPFKKRNVLISLWMRLATEIDVRPSRPNMKSKWARTVVGARGREGPLDGKPRLRLPDRPRALESGAEEESLRLRRVGGTKRRGREEKRSGDLLQKISGRRLRVRGGIAKVRAKKPSLMDVDKALESK